jgi:phosphoglucomutase
MKEKILNWTHKCNDKDFLDELNSIQDELDLYDRFYKDLSFGTGGLRGLMGVGSNRMNIYTVRQASQGIAKTLKDVRQNEYKIVIGYDSRIHSKRFAQEVACVFASNGFKVFIFDDLRPTPEISFAVRELKCDVGVVITASHNPKEYNGYKVYGSDGGQITLELADIYASAIQNIDPFSIETLSFSAYFNHQNIQFLDATFDLNYLTRILNLPIFHQTMPRSAKIVYTPIHGAGYQLIKQIFEMRGYQSINYVESQIQPDGNFPTVKSPNPEEKEALNLGIELAQSIKADLVLATDPDCDRVGIAVRNHDQMVLLSGNQVGALLVNYMLEVHPNVTQKTAIVKTIVTSDLGKRIAKSYGATVFETLTGFKYIGEKIREFEENHSYEFLLGFEESYGYLSGTFVRDKDAVIASLLIAEMYSYYASKDLSLLEVINQLYLKFGSFKEELLSFTFKGEVGVLKIKELVGKFSDQEFLISNFNEVNSIENYQTLTRQFTNGNCEKILLPHSDVIKVIFKDESWFAIRPSGTEPKIKVYLSVIAPKNNLAEEKLSYLKSKIKDLLDL